MQQDSRLGGGRGGGPEPRPEVRPLPRRWIMLAQLFAVSMANGFQWIQFTIISDSVEWYYGVPIQAVDWTSLLYMVTYIPCILPASWFLDKKGLRWTVAVAAAGNCAAAWLKVAAVQPELFGVLFLGQATAAVTQGFVLSVPPRLAAVWFGEHQVSTATALGVIGNQVGNALGFVVPSLLVRSPKQPGTSIETMSEDMRLVGYIVAGTTSLTLLLVLLVFQAAPPIPPSRARAAVGSSGSRERAESLRQFLSSVKSLVVSPGFPQLLVSYSISTGVCFAASTVLNTLILKVFKDSEDDAGLIGLAMVVSGLVGSALCGLVLDATARFKEMTVTVYFLSVAAMVAFTVSLFVGKLWFVYVAGALAGFTLAGYVPVGFDFAAELTYPASEGTSSGILSAAASLMGVVFTLACSRLLMKDMDEARGWLWACGMLLAVLLLGAGVTLTIPNNLRRQQAQHSS